MVWVTRITDEQLNTPVILGFEIYPHVLWLTGTSMCAGPLE